MSISNTTKINALFKSLLGREHTANEKTWYEEFSAATKILNQTEVLLEDIPEETPSTNTNIISILSKHTLTEILTVPGHKAWKILEDPADPNSNRISKLIHPRFGQGYNVKIYDANDVEIPPTSSAGWLFFYESGILIFENDPTQYGYSLPLKIDGYRYVGKVLRSQGYNDPIINDVSFNTYNQYSQQTYNLTISAYSPIGNSLTYDVACSDTNVTIVQDTNDPTVFHITYPIYNTPVIVEFDITVTDSTGANVTVIFNSRVYPESNVPQISSVTWNKSTHFSNNEYLVTIDASDPNNQVLTYDVSCDDIGVTITQDGTDPNKFHIVYSDYSENKDIKYTFTVTNEDNVSYSQTETITVHSVDTILSPIIVSVDWNDSVQYEQETYDLTIEAINYSQSDIIYTVDCNDSNVVITQDTVDPSIFHITYPDYSKPNMVTFRIRVTDGTEKYSTKFTTKIVKPKPNPNIDDIQWSSQTLVANSTYDLTIIASDPNNYSINYSIDCSDTNVTINQDTTNPNIFHIGFPKYSADITLTFKITATNEQGSNTSILFKALVNGEVRNNPIIHNLSWDNNNQWEQNTYDLIIDAFSPNDLDLTYQLTCNDGSVTIVQDTTDPNIFHVTYPNYGNLSTIILYKVKVIDSNGEFTNTFLNQGINVKRPLVVTDLIFDDYFQIGGNSYNATVTYNSPYNLNLTECRLKCNDTNVTIVQDTNDPTKFTVTYPDYDNDVELLYSVELIDENGLSTVKTFTIGVNKNQVYHPPVINSVSWNQYKQYINHTYILDIEASDPNNRSLSYSVTNISGSSVTITQDSKLPYRFYIHYGWYPSNTDIQLRVKVVNDIGLFDLHDEYMTVLYYTNDIPPEIQDVSWSDDTHYEQNIYSLTITTNDKHDLDTSVEITALDPDIKITFTNKSNTQPQEHHFIVEYPEYTKPFPVEFTIVATNIHQVSSTKHIFKEVNIYDNPSIQSVSWDMDGFTDNTWNPNVHYEQNTYKLIINASDPNGLPLTYQVSCDHPEVIIGSNTSNVFPVTYNRIDVTTNVRYVISVTNNKSKSSSFVINNIVNPYPKPKINRVSWDKSNHVEAKTYLMNIDAIDYNSRHLEYKVIPDNHRVKVKQHYRYPYKFYVTYPPITEGTDFDFTVIVTNVFGYTDTITVNTPVYNIQDRRPPVITNVYWASNFHRRNQDATLIVDAYDPNNFQLSYQLNFAGGTPIWHYSHDDDQPIFNYKFYLPNNSFKDWREEVDETYEIIVTNEKGTKDYYTISHIVTEAEYPVITNITWDNERHDGLSTRYLSIDAYNNEIGRLHYSVSCDDPNVSISVVPDSPNQFKITYPSYPIEGSLVTFNIRVWNDWGQYSVDSIVKKVFGYKSPVINSVTWNDVNHIEQQSYNVTIDALDPYNETLKYELISKDPNVTIVQDTNDPTKFTVTYPSYDSNNRVKFIATVTNTRKRSTTATVVTKVISYSGYIIESIDWTPNTLHHEQNTYTMTISKSPLFKYLSLEYSLSCNDTNVTIVQDTDPKIFHVTYPIYSENTSVSYNLRVHDITKDIYVDIPILESIGVYLPPLIDRVEWDDNDRPCKNRSYTMTIFAYNDDNLSISNYQVSCDDTNVTIVQDTNDPKIFHVTYPDYSVPTMVEFTVIVTNEKSKSTNEKISKRVELEIVPQITDISWSDSYFWEQRDYLVTIHSNIDDELYTTYEAEANNSNVLIHKIGTNTKNIFRVTFKDFVDPTDVTFTFKVFNRYGTKATATDTVTVHTHNNPSIDNITWNIPEHFENQSYDMTVHASDPNNLELTYQVTSDDPGVTIVQDTTNPNIFHVTYPFYDFIKVVTFTIMVTNSDLLSDTTTDSKVIQIGEYPVIDRVEWNDSEHWERNTYDLTVIANSPSGLPLTYQLTCNDTNVTITQDGTDPSIFHVTYPPLDKYKTVTYTTTVTSSDGKYVTLDDKKWVNIYSPPSISSITWNSDKLYEETMYDMTISASDPYGLPLTYQVTCDNPNTIITQDGTDPSIFHVTFPNVTNNTNITFTATVTNTDEQSASKTDQQTCLVTGTTTIDSIVWSNDTHYDISNYDLTINASDSIGLALTYQVVADNPDVTITQDTTNLNIFHITYPMFSVETDVTYTITVTNTNDITVDTTDIKTVHILSTPIVDGVIWSDEPLFETESYDVIASVIGDRGQSYTIDLSSDDSNVTIVQDTNDSNIFHVTYPSYSVNTDVTFTFTTYSNDGNIYSTYEFTETIQAYSAPTIDSLVWSDSTFWEQNTYDLTINASDANGFDLSYQVVADDTNVTIVQDGTNLNIFHVTYPDYSFNTDVTFTITVDNSKKSTSTNDIVTVKVESVITIDSIVWSDDYQYDNNSYDMTINASDSAGLALTYQVVADNPDVIITQDITNSNVFHIEYSTFPSETNVTYTITVTDENDISVGTTDIKTVHILSTPIVDGVIWSDEPLFETESYDVIASVTGDRGQSYTIDLSSDDPNVTIVQDTNDQTVFHVTYPSYSVNTDVTFTFTTYSNDGNIYSTYEFIETIQAYSAPTIGSLVWSDSTFWEQNTYDLTINASDANGFDLGYQVVADDTNVTIVQDTIDPNIFHITYPDYTVDTNVTFTITVDNSKKSTSTTDIVTVNAERMIIIDNISWSDDYHYDNSSYDITISAHDIHGLALTYQVVADDPNVSIVQDTTNLNVFHIGYSAFPSESDVTYTITVTNSDGITVDTTDIKTVHILSTPVVNDVIWSDEPLFETESYDVMASVTGDRGQSYTIDLSSDDPNVIITQDTTDPNIFHVTYPSYSVNTDVTFTFTTYSNNGNVYSTYEFTETIQAYSAPTIDSLVWNDSIFVEQNTYDLTINASDANGFDLSYQVVADDTNVTIVQDGTNLNIFHVTYPDYTVDTDVTFTITVDNSKKSTSTTDIVTVITN